MAVVGDDLQRLDGQAVLGIDLAALTDRPAGGGKAKHKAEEKTTHKHGDQRSKGLLVGT